MRLETNTPLHYAVMAIVCALIGHYWIRDDRHVIACQFCHKLKSRTAS